MARLKDKVAIITGAAQGIGAEYAREMAKEGAKIVIADIDNGEKLETDILNGNCKLQWIWCLAGGHASWQCWADCAQEPCEYAHCGLVGWQVLGAVGGGATVAHRPRDIELRRRRDV